MVNHPKDPDRPNPHELNARAKDVLASFPMTLRIPLTSLFKRCNLEPTQQLRFMQMYPERSGTIDLILTLAASPEIPGDTLGRIAAASLSEAAHKRFAELVRAICEVRKISMTDAFRQEVITIISEAAAITYNLPHPSTRPSGDDLIGLAVIMAEGKERGLLRDNQEIVPQDVRIVKTLLTHSLVDVVRDFYEFKRCSGAPEFYSAGQVAAYFKDHRFIVSKGELSAVIFSAPEGTAAEISLKTLGRALASKTNQVSPQNADLVLEFLSSPRLPPELAYWLIVNLAGARLTDCDLNMICALCQGLKRTTSGGLARDFLQKLASQDYSPTERNRGLHLLQHIVSSEIESDDFAILSRFGEGKGISDLEQALFGRSLNNLARVVPDRPIHELVTELLRAKDRGLNAPDEAVVLETAAIISKIIKNGLDVDTLLPPNLSGFDEHADPNEASKKYWETYGTWARAWCHKAFGFAPSTAQLFALILGAKQMEQAKAQGGRGAWVEFATGEGKSLVLALMAGHQVCRGKCAFVTAPNRYLANRDSELFTPMFEALGARVVEVGQVAQRTYFPPQPLVVYAAVKELIYAVIDLTAKGRPVLSHGSGKVILLDEVDALLIDNGTRQHWRYKGGSQNYPALSEKLLQYWKRLYRHRDQLSSDHLASAAYLAAKEPEVFGGINPVLLSLHSRSASLSLQLKIGVDYALSGGEVVVIDRVETERLLPHSVWIHGLHQLVAVGKGLPPPERGELIGASSPYEMLSLFGEIFCCSGTIGNQSERDELRNTYCLTGSHIPSNNRSQRIDHSLHLYRTDSELWAALLKNVADVHSLGRPILVVAGSIRQAFEIRRLLARNISLIQGSSGIQLITDLENRATDGQSVSEELLVDCAGQAGMITVATAMVGRGTDIRLSEESVKAGGLHVIVCGTPNLQRGEAQIRRRAARQGQPGSSIVLASLQSDRFIRSLPVAAQEILSKELNSRGYQAGSERLSDIFDFCRNAITLLQSTKRQIMVDHRTQIQKAVSRYLDDHRGQSDMDSREDLNLFPAEVAGLVINHLIKAKKIPSILKESEHEREEFLELDRLFEEAFHTKPPPLGSLDDAAAKLYELFAHNLRVNIAAATYLGEERFYAALISYAAEFRAQVAAQKRLTFGGWEGSA